MKATLIYLLVITIAELTNILIHPLLGMLCHVLILVAVIMHSAIAGGYRYRELIMSFALVPLVRIVSLSIPLANIPPLWWYPIIYTPLLVGGAVVARIIGYSPEQIGVTIKRPWLQLGISTSGIVLGISEYLILRPPPFVVGHTWQQLWLPALIFVVTTGFVEEFVFRGVLQRVAQESFGWWGIIFVTYLFAILHVIHVSLIDIAFVFAVGLFFSWVVKKTGSLLGVILAHGMTNIILYVLAPNFF